MHVSVFIFRQHSVSSPVPNDCGVGIASLPYTTVWWDGQTTGQTEVFMKPMMQQKVISINNMHNSGTHIISELSNNITIDPLGDIEWWSKMVSRIL